MNLDYLRKRQVNGLTTLTTFEQNFR
jgi:hypothetical protein